ncbi:hypothetical protein [Bacillus phage BC-T25]|nr:hypothetical protein [Bacillus phage BC-T25]
MKRLEARVEKYEGRSDLTKHGYLSHGELCGRILAKEMELMFIEDLLKEEGEHEGQD